MADFKKGSNEFNLPTRAGGQLALKHRKYIVAGQMNNDNFIIFDEDNGTTNTLTPSENSEYVTASICLHAPAIIHCFIDNGILKNSSDTSTLPIYLNTSNVEFINYDKWSIKFSYGGRNFVLSPLTGNITCKSTSLYRHTINLTYTSSVTYFNIFFDIINNYGKKYTSFNQVKDAIKSICNNNELAAILFPCNGCYTAYNTESTLFPYGNPNGFVTGITYFTDNSFRCNVSSLYKDRDGNYQYNTSQYTISSANAVDIVRLLA